MVARRQEAVKQRGAAGDAFSGLAFRVLRLAALLETEGNALAAPVGQSSARWQVLAAVEQAPLTVASIARALGLARQSVQRVADRLAAEGLVAYEDNPAHARARLVGLSEPGRTALSGIQAAQAHWARETAEGMDPERLTAAAEVLDELRARLDARH